MIELEAIIIAKLSSYREVMDRVRKEVLRLVGEKVVKLREAYFVAWFG